MDFALEVISVTDSYVDDDSASVILMDQNSNNMEDIRDIFLNNFSSMDAGNEVKFLFTPDIFLNLSTLPSLIDNDSVLKSEIGFRDPMTIILPITVIYVIIFIAGVLGNVITCVVIYKNKTMHTATNYYLFNLAVSDFLVLIFGK